MTATAFKQGWVHAERGLSLHNCPYMKGTGSAIAWRNGWRGLHESIYWATDVEWTWPRENQERRSK